MPKGEKSLNITELRYLVAIMQWGSVSAAAKPAAGKPMLQLSAGDQVNHKTFGDGMVISVTPMGGDALIEVAFEQVGTKKLMLKTAGVHMTKK